MAACSFGKKVLHSVLRATSGPLAPSLRGKPHCKRSDTMALPSWVAMPCTYKRCSPRLNNPSAVPCKWYSAAMAKKGEVGAAILWYFCARCSVHGSWRWATSVLILGHRANSITTPLTTTTPSDNSTVTQLLWRGAPEGGGKHQIGGWR